MGKKQSKLMANETPLMKRMVYGVSVKDGLLLLFFSALAMLIVWPWYHDRWVDLSDVFVFVCGAIGGWFGLRQRAAKKRSSKSLVD